MKRTCIHFLIIVLVFTGSLLTTANAGEKLTKKEVRQVIADNTVEETFTEKPWQNKIYFIADGNFKRIDQNGNWILENGILTLMDRYVSNERNVNAGIWKLLKMRFIT